MRKRLWWCLIIWACLAPAARAQDVEVFGGYSYMGINGTNFENVGLNGWNAEVSVGRKSWSVVADFSSHYGAKEFYFTPIGNGGHGATFLVGPQYSFRKLPHVTPFVHALVGTAHGVIDTFAVEPGGVCPGLCSGPFVGRAENAFAMAFGVGFDVKLRDHIWIRPVQADYIQQNFTGSAVHSPRVSTGIVFRFGGGEKNGRY